MKIYKHYSFTFRTLQLVWRAKNRGNSHGIPIEKLKHKCKSYPLTGNEKMAVETIVEGKFAKMALMLKVRYRVRVDMSEGEDWKKQLKCLLGRGSLGQDGTKEGLNWGRGLKRRLGPEKTTPVDYTPIGCIHSWTSLPNLAITAIQHYLREDQYRSEDETCRPPAPPDSSETLKCCDHQFSFTSPRTKPSAAPPKALAWAATHPPQTSSGNPPHTHSAKP